MSEPVQAQLVQGVEITITPRNVGEEHKITIFEVEIINKQTSPPGSWDQTFGTEGELRAFIRGLEAGGMMIGGKHVFRPPMPRSDY